MRSKVNHLWLLVGITWLAALFTTYWNYTRINDVATIREHNELLRKEMLFQHRNDRQLAQIQKVQGSFYLPVASLKLGFETVRSQLNTLAARLGIGNLRIDYQTEQATDALIPFNLTMTSDLANAKRFISALHMLPYLSIKHSSITVPTARKQAEIEMELCFQFKIAPEDRTESPPLQAAAKSPSAGKAGR
jgi:hypothetical protein